MVQSKMNRDVINKLRRKRIKLKVSISALSRYISCSRSSLWYWEKSLHIPKEEYVEKWEAALSKIENGEILCKAMRLYGRKQEVTVSRSKVQELRDFRLRLKIPQNTTSVFVLDRCKTYLCKLETGKTKMTLCEYETLLKYHREMEKRTESKK